jgi:ribonuclease-3
VHSIEYLLHKLNYAFKNIDLLKAALTHRSIRGQNNERLEFLGDSLLNFIIAEQLYKTFLSAEEGDLSRLRAILVKGDTLAEIAQEFCLGDYLRLGPGELKSGGFLRKSILADAFEAVIGAIYLDSDFETCREHVLSWFASRIKEVHLAIQKDPKTRLQEYLQSRHLPLPKYEILAIEGEAHAQLFHIECRVLGLSYATTSVGSSRRKAEQLAAEKYLELLNL